jgi:hypothetical protein
MVITQSLTKALRRRRVIRRRMIRKSGRKMIRNLTSLV